MKEYIWVLDYSTNHVYRYTTDLLENKQEVEEFLISQGHRLSNINWINTDSKEPNYE